MHSLLLVTLFTIACALFPQSATAQSQSRYAPRQAKTQIAFKAPAANRTSDMQENFAAAEGGNFAARAGNLAVQGQNAPGAPNSLNNPGWSNQSFDYSNGVAQSGNGFGNSSGDTWTAEQSGTANAYNYSDPSATQAGSQGGNGRGYDRAYDTYAMSAADVLAARRAVLDGSFFSYHGTQSSQTSRNR